MMDDWARESELERVRVIREAELLSVSVISADQMIDPAARIVSVGNDAHADHDGAMVAFFLKPADARKLAVDGGEPAADLHVTLAYFKDKAVDQAEEHWDKVDRVVAEVAREWAPLYGSIAGWGRFSVEEGDTEPFVLSLDVLGLGALQQRLDEALEAADAPLSREHGFNPHVTLAYLAKDADDPDVSDELPMDLTVDALTFTVGGERTEHKLTGEARVARSFPGYLRHAGDRTRDTNMAHTLIEVEDDPLPEVVVEAPAEDPADDTVRQGVFSRLRSMFSIAKPQDEWRWHHAEANPEPQSTPAEIALRALQQEGGFTLTQSGGMPPNLGYVASFQGFESAIPAEQVGTQQIEEKIRQGASLGDAEVLVGGWFNQADGLVYLDLSRGFAKFEDCAAFAQENLQKAIFDAYHGIELAWSDAHQTYVPDEQAHHRPTGSADMKGEFFRNTLRNIIPIPDLFAPSEPPVADPEAAPVEAEVIPFPTPPAAQEPSEMPRAAHIYDWERDGD